ncbi:MAG: 5-deoxy-glucuronate isomerase [Proteobacteria bacterium]|nr:5-deoxy-glucuronate isomerase [Pseudomonadota bacterium]
MPKLLLKPKKGQGRVISVTPKSAKWKYVGHDVWKLAPGKVAKGLETGRETCIVFISGKGEVKIGGQSFGLIGERMSVFEGKPWSVYVPPGLRWSVTAATDCVINICTAPAKGKREPFVIPPDSLSIETRGAGSNTRHVCNILPEQDRRAESLLVVEVITPNGCTSSYPSHKHDRNNLPHESLLEETYYHRLNPPQGFAFQRVYTDDRKLDEAMAVEDGDVVLVPKGYHPCAAIHGYDLYYLNVMAGPVRTWKFHNAKEHAWLLKK